MLGRPLSVVKVLLTPHEHKAALYKNIFQMLISPKPHIQSLVLKKVDLEHSSTNKD